MRKARWMMAAAGAFSLAACSVEKEQAASNEAAGVARQAAAPSPAPSPSPPPSAPPATTPIQTQPGPEGRYVDLLRANVTGDVLSVTLTYRAAPGTRSNGRRWHDSTDFKIDEVSAVDDATSQRLGVLKDDRGKWMAAPLGGSQPDEVRIEAGDEDVQAWFKFPAPSANAKTVSINIPGAGSFDAVPLAQ